MSVFDKAVSRTYRAIIAFDDEYGFGDHQHLAMEIVRKLAEDGLLIMDSLPDEDEEDTDVPEGITLPVMDGNALAQMLSQGASTRSQRQYMDCRDCGELRYHTRHAGCVLFQDALDRTLTEHAGTLRRLANDESVEALILSNKTFGDVDYGPDAGVRYVLRYDGQGEPGELGDALWQYLSANYEDEFQEWRLVATDKDTITVDVYTFWGDGHPSITP